MMKKQNIPGVVALVGACALFVVGGAQAGAPAKESATEAAQAVAAKGPRNIVATAVAAGSFKTLVTALQAAGLVDLLSGPGPFTVFAPTDEAFAKLPAGTVDALLKDPAKLRTILTYHVVPGRVMAADVEKLTEARTAERRKVAIDARDGVKVGGAKVVKTDIACSNGVIHVIDSVMLPK